MKLVKQSLVFLFFAISITSIFVIYEESTFTNKVLIANKHLSLLLDQINVKDKCEK